MAPDVSVIIPAYNTEAYVGRAIESALGQTLKNIEVIVVDDASTDATSEVARGFVDQRLKVLVNQQNLGVSGARNRALKNAKGKWIAVLDSDDWYAPERLEKLLQVADVEDADLVADNLHFIQDGEKSPWATLVSQSGEPMDRICQIDAVHFVETDMYGQQGLHLGISKPLFKRSFLVEHGIEYDESVKVSEDFWFDLSCLIKGARFIFIPKPYYFYRSRPGSLVRQSQVKHLDQLCRVTSEFLQKDAVKSNPKLVRALVKKLEICRRNRAYQRVVEPLKRKEVLAALISLVNNPYFFVHFAGQLRSILERRVQYYLLGNKAAYEVMYQRGKS